MSRFTPKPAVRVGQKARVALSGPSGSGKTWDALELATALAEGGPILVVDTERGSSALYSDRFSFEIIDWTPPYNPRELAEEIHARAASYAVLVIDSLTHFWEGQGGTRDIVDAAAARSKGNSFAGWKEGTPAQDAMVQAILSAPCHVIATMRSKTEFVLETNRDGKQVPRKVGMQPIQRPGLEYEFTVTCEVDRDHVLMVDKSRCVDLSDEVFKPHEVRNLAATLSAWLADNEPAPEDEPLADAGTHDGLRSMVRAWPDDLKKKVVDWMAEHGYPAFGERDALTISQAESLNDFIEQIDPPPGEQQEPSTAPQTTEAPTSTDAAAPAAPVTVPAKNSPARAIKEGLRDGTLPKDKAEEPAA